MILFYHHFCIINYNFFLCHFRACLWVIYHCLTSSNIILLQVYFKNLTIIYFYFSISNLCAIVIVKFTTLYVTNSTICAITFYFGRLYLFIFRQKGREKERKRNIMWEKNIDWLPLPHAPTRDQTLNPGSRLDQNQTGDLLLCGTMPNKLSYPNQSTCHYLNSYSCSLFLCVHPCFLLKSFSFCPEDLPLTRLDINISSWWNHSAFVYLKHCLFFISKRFLGKIFYFHSFLFFK